MQRVMRVLTGILLLSAAVVGWLGSGVGVYAVWHYKAPATMALTQAAITAESGIDATRKLLELVDLTLVQTEKSVALLGDSVDTAASALDASADLADSAAGLISEGISVTLDETQEALDTVATSARLIDDTVAFIAAIPLIGAKYEPEKTLEESIQGLSDSLDNTPESLAKIQGNLETTAEDLNTLQTNLTELSKSVVEIQDGMGESREVLAGYDDSLGKARDFAVKAQTRLPVWMTWLGVGMTVLLVWLFIAQVLLFLKGLELMGKPVEPQLPDAGQQVSA
jgi:hypothetical protein